MTDRYVGFLVALENPMRDDDSQATLAAIRQIKGVVDVKPVIGDHNTMIGDMRARRRLSEQLLSLVAVLDRQ